MAFVSIGQKYGFESIADSYRKEVADARVEERENIAREMLTNNEPIDKIIRYSHLSENEVLHTKPIKSSFKYVKKDAHGTLNTQLITHLRTQIHQVVIHKTCMRVMVFYVHEAESIFLVKGNSLQICVNSQESATGVPPDCHCEPRRGEAIPIQKSKFILKQVIPLGILRLY